MSASAAWLLWVSWWSLAPPSGGTWLNAAGRPLPFENDDALVEFLQTATVVSEKTLDVGINHSRKVLLEKDGVQAHAIFREANVRKSSVRVGERYYEEFSDSYLFECAAYELARLLGLSNVPPATMREVEGKRGSVQIWLENVLDEEAHGFRPPDPSAWAAQLWDRSLFDALIFNVDRNEGNILVDESYKLWLVDHTRAFQKVPELFQPDKVIRIRRSLWERLVALEDKEIRGALRPYLDREEIEALVKRRRLLLAHVRSLVAERGEDVVFYD